LIFPFFLLLLWAGEYSVLFFHLSYDIIPLLLCVSIDPLCESSVRLLVGHDPSIHRFNFPSPFHPSQVSSLSKPLLLCYPYLPISPYFPTHRIPKYHTSTPEYLNTPSPPNSTSQSAKERLPLRVPMQYISALVS